MGIKESIETELAKRLKDESNKEIIQAEVDKQLTQYFNSSEFQSMIKQAIQSEDFKDKTYKRINIAINHALQDNFKVNGGYNGEHDYVPVGKMAVKLFKTTQEHLEKENTQICNTVKEKLKDGRLDKKIDTLLNKFLSSSKCQNMLNNTFLPVIKQANDEILNQKSKIQEFKQEVQGKVENQLNRMIKKAKIHF